MSEATDLVPTETRDVDFYGDTLTGALVPFEGESRIYVPVKPICDYLGVNWSAQRQRINRDKVLAGGMVVITMPSPSGLQPTACLPLDLIPGFLFGMSVARVRPELQDKIDRYRRECFRVLWEAFRPSIAPATSVPTPGLSPAALAYELATAVANLAREQMELERRMHAAATWAKGVESRLSALELSVSPGQAISEPQAAELALQVKAVAHALGQHGTPNPYQVVYGELYRRFGIGTYRALPKRRYQEAIDWLTAWHTEASGADQTTGEQG